MPTIGCCCALPLCPSRSAGLSAGRQGRRDLLARLGESMRLIALDLDIVETPSDSLVAIVVRMM